MIKINRIGIILLLIFLLTLSFRLYYTFQVDGFSNDEGYFNLRYIENIIQHKDISFYDPLSYGGRESIQPPLFYLLMAILSFGNVILLKIIPEILFSTLVFLIYLITKEITNDESSALTATLIGTFVPLFFEQTLNNLSVYSLALPLLFLMMYSMLKLEDKKYLWIFIICSFLLPLTHAISILFIITILIYIFLMAGGAVQPTKLKKEAMLFSILVILLVQLIIYKRALLSYGINIIWQNLPVNILIDRYSALTLTQLVLGVGILPLVLGSIGMYFGLTKEKTKSVYLFGAFVTSMLILLTLRLFTMNIGLMILGIALSIFSGLAIKKIIDYFNKTKLIYLTKIFLILVFVLFISFSFIPSYTSAKTISQIDEYEAEDMKWLDYYTPLNVTVLGNIQEGNLITAIGKRADVIDTNFLLAPNPIERLDDVKTIYTTFNEAKVLTLIKKYKINMIYLSDDTKQIYNIENLSYAKGSNCFDTLRGGRFYVVQC